MISIIVAVSENNVIGKNNQLLWRLSSDLKRFKSLTTNHTIMMGRKTYDSIGRPLPNRRNIVISKSVEAIDGCEVISSVSEAIELAKSAEDEIFIIGGGMIYKKFLPFADKIYLTKVKSNFTGDVYFPEINETEWIQISSESFCSDEKNEYDYEFIDYVRR